MEAARTAVNPLHTVRTAGKSFRGKDESVADCLSFPVRPETVGASARYRREQEPGQRIRHFGFRGDPIPYDVVHGSVDKRPPVHSSDVLNVAKPPMQEMMDAKAEAAYYKSAKRAPLGHVSVPCSDTLPSYVQKNEIAFGRPSGEGDAMRQDGSNAKEALFPTPPTPESEVLGEELYSKSHHSYAPGARRSYGVSWSSAGIDPTLHTFGKKSGEGSVGVPGSIKNNSAAAMDPYSMDKDMKETPVGTVRMLGGGQNASASSSPASMPGFGLVAAGVERGLGRLIPKSVADFKRFTADEIGLPRGRGAIDASLHPAVFGRPSKTNRDSGDWTAADCLRGDALPEETAADATLGRSVPRGHRPGLAAQGASVPQPFRVFGLPSIRTDVPPRGNQSVAAGMDFGDGPSAGSLLQPSPYAEHGVDEADFVKPRSRADLRGIFGGAGYNFSELEVAAKLAFESIYERGCALQVLTPRGMCSVEEFRRCLDEVLEAETEGEPLPAWFRGSSILCFKHNA